MPPTKQLSNAYSSLCDLHRGFLSPVVFNDKQGKSEGFESCDRPIVRKRPIWVKIGDVLSHVTLKFDGWPWKKIGHLSLAVSSFVQHFIAIGEFKLELQSGDAKFGSNSTIFSSRVTLKFDRWHWKTIGHLFYATSSFVHHFVAIGELKLELQSGNTKSGSNSTCQTVKNLSEIC